MSQICSRLASGDWKIYWDHVNSVPFLTKGKSWISFDSLASFHAKILALSPFVFSGFMLSSVESDDNSLTCGPMSVLQLFGNSTNLFDPNAARLITFIKFYSEIFE